MKTCKKLEKTRKWKLVAEDFASQKWSSLFRDEFFSYVSGKPLYCIKYHSSSIINSKHNLNIFIPFSLNNNKQQTTSTEHKRRRNTKSYRRPATRQQCIFTLSNVGRTSFPRYGTTCPRYSWGTDFRFLYLLSVVILMHTFNGFDVSLFCGIDLFFATFFSVGKCFWYYLYQTKKSQKWRSNFGGDELVNIVDATELTKLSFFLSFTIRYTNPYQRMQMRNKTLFNNGCNSWMNMKRKLTTSTRGLMDVWELLIPLEVCPLNGKLKWNYKSSR